MRKAAEQRADSHGGGPNALLPEEVASFVAKFRVLYGPGPSTFTSEAETPEWSGLEAEHVEQGSAHVNPTAFGQDSNQRSKMDSFHDANPLGLQDAGGGKSIGRSQRDLPDKLTDLTRDRDDGDLRKRRKNVVASQHEHGTALVRCGEAKPADLSAPDHGNSGASSSAIGPSAPRAIHESHACRRAAASVVVSSTASTTSRTRWPSSSGTGASSSITFPWTRPITAADIFERYRTIWGTAMRRVVF